MLALKLSQQLRGTHSDGRIAQVPLEEQRNVLGIILRFTDVEMSFR